MHSSASFTYPRLIRRVQALLIDSVLLAVCPLGAMVAATSVGVKGSYAAFLAGFLIFLLGPGLVSFTGGTVGHHLRGLAVIHQKSGKKLNILVAIVRFLFKVLLGWLSLLTYFTTTRYQAFHDLVSWSVVVLKQPEKEDGFERLNQRKFKHSDYIYPSIWRQVFIVLIYNLVFLLFTFVAVVFASEMACQYYVSYCEGATIALGIIWEVAAIVFLAVSIYYCRLGKIWGCRRKPLHKSYLS